LGKLVEVANVSLSVMITLVLLSRLRTGLLIIMCSPRPGVAPDMWASRES